LRRTDHHREPHTDVEGRAHEQNLDRLEVQLRVAEQEHVHDPFRLLQDMCINKNKMLVDAVAMQKTGQKTCMYNTHLHFAFAVLKIVPSN
jgi:hypothetical protein